jgi:hypothetical protein
MTTSPSRDLHTNHDVWLKYTSAKGESHVAHHRVWDAKLFLERRAAEAKKEGGTVEQVARPPFRGNGNG